MRDPYLLELDENLAASKSESVLLNVGKMFFLDSQYRPGPSVFELHRRMVFHPGDFVTFRIEPAKSGKLSHVRSDVGK